jgi:hypothetical protein
VRGWQIEHGRRNTRARVRPVKPARRRATHRAVDHPLDHQQEEGPLGSLTHQVGSHHTRSVHDTARPRIQRVVVQPARSRSQPPGVGAFPIPAGPSAPATCGREGSERPVVTTAHHQVHPRRESPPERGLATGPSPSARIRWLARPAWSSARRSQRRAARAASPSLRAATPGGRAARTGQAGSQRREGARLEPVGRSGASQARSSQRKAR